LVVERLAVAVEHGTVAKIASFVATVDENRQ
jgi:hypothetical protein